MDDAWQTLGSRDSLRRRSRPGRDYTGSRICAAWWRPGAGPDRRYWLFPCRNVAETQAGL